MPRIDNAKNSDYFHEGTQHLHCAKSSNANGSDGTSIADIPKERGGQDDGMVAPRFIVS
jgi:hypothetical protein